MDINALVPLFLSLNYCSYITLCKDITLTPLKINIVDENPHNIEKAQFFLDLLAPSRKNHEVYWSEVGQALYNCTRGSKKGLDVWRQWTEDSSIKNPDDCRKI